MEMLRTFRVTVDQLRDLWPNTLVSYKDNYQVLAAALDSIEDTHEAFKTFMSLDPQDDNVPKSGPHLILIYGFLESVYIQQQAIELLCTVFGVPKPKTSEIAMLRHKITHCVGKSSVFLVRMSLNIPSTCQTLEFTKKNGKKKSSVVNSKYDLVGMLDDYLVIANKKLLQCLAKISVPSAHRQSVSTSSKDSPGQG